MDAALKKGVVLLVVLFLGWYLFTDPNRLAEMAQDGGAKAWTRLVDLFEAVARFIGALGDEVGVVGLRHALTDPDIGRHLLRDEGEVIVDEVRRYWVVYVGPVLIVLLGLAFLVVFAVTSLTLAWFPLLLAGGLILYEAWLALSQNMDRFVITNMRVFRVKGVIARSLATMPLGRILDITVYKPLHGRLLGFGHFVFESAAQEQGLREIRFVGPPDERDLSIQRVVQRSGLLGPRVN